MRNDAGRGVAGRGPGAGAGEGWWSTARHENAIMQAIRGGRIRRCTGMWYGFQRFTAHHP